MAELGKEYKRILAEIESSITNENERKIVVKKVEELSSLFVKKIEYLNNTFDKRIKNVEENERVLSLMLKQLQQSVNEIQCDIYEDEQDGDEYDFEIVCPYCNTEFVTDISMMNEDKNEIKCPECNNIIELDWNDEEDEAGCGGHCGGCHGCDAQDYDEDDDM